MAKPRNDLIDRLQYVGLRVVAMMLQCWPVEWCLAGARLLGDVWWYAVPKHRRRALEHLAFAFPDRTAAERERIARASFRWMFQLGVDILFTTRLLHTGTWTRVVTLHDFEPTLRLLLDPRRGLILLTGHYGNWEILGYLLATLGFRTTSVARPLDNRYVNHWLLGVRERRGQRILAKTGATAEIPDLLEAGGTVGFIADQNAGSKGLFVDFFGRKASTYKSIALLALRYEVPVVVGYARRRDGRFHFDIRTQDIILPEHWAGREDPVRYITQRYTSAIEAFVREDPSQYLWIHRRWKSRPKDELPPPLPAKAPTA
ncbi:MAG: lysophospholipid acyltransferase family protein [Tepidisphaerales bacterium]